MTHFLSLPLSAFSQKRDMVDEAMSDAKRATTQYSEDFGVFEVTLVGVYRAVSPIWEERDDIPVLPAKPGLAARSPNSAPDNDVPF